jgi:hypothetical protein
MQFLLFANHRSSGAISLGVCPLSHRSCQKLVFAPSPTVVVVHMRNSSCSVVVCASGSFDHGF